MLVLQKTSIRRYQTREISTNLDQEGTDKQGNDGNDHERFHQRESSCATSKTPWG